MKKFYPLILFFILILTGCSKDPETPESIPPKLVVSDSVLDFDSLKTQLPITIRNSGNGVIKWKTVTGDMSWIKSIPDSGSVGSSEQLILIQVNRDLMTAGQNNGEIYISTSFAGYKKITIKALNPQVTGGITDIDGNSYHAVKIGSQYWLKENLKVKHSPDGDAISYSPPDGDESNVKEYGCLYTWDVAMRYSTNPVNQGICPDGWRIPNDDDWQTLINFAGGMDLAGGELKETGTSHWESPNIGATDKYSFSAIGAGDRHNTGAYDWFNRGGIYWSATLYNSADAMYWSFRNYDDDGYTINCYRDNWLSVRCIKSDK